MSDLEVGGRLRRVMIDKHYGPGPHPGTHTSQDIHGERNRIGSEEYEIIKKFRSGHGNRDDLTYWWTGILSDEFEGERWSHVILDRAGMPEYAQERFLDSIPKGDTDEFVRQLNLYFIKNREPITYLRAFNPDFEDKRPPGESDKYSPDEPWGHDMRRSGLVERLNEIEDEIAELPYEVGHIINEDGEVLEKRKGGKDYIQWDETTPMEGNIMVHNHPSGSPISPQDIMVAMINGARETIVIGPEYRYMVKIRPGTFIGGHTNEYKNFANIVNDQFSMIRGKFQAEVSDYNLSAWHAGNNDYHELWLEMERRFPSDFDYTRQRRHYGRD